MVQVCGVEVVLPLGRRLELLLCPLMLWRRLLLLCEREQPLVSFSLLGRVNETHSAMRKRSSSAASGLLVAL